MHVMVRQTSFRDVRLWLGHCPDVLIKKKRKRKQSHTGELMWNCLWKLTRVFLPMHFSPVVNYIVKVVNFVLYSRNLCFYSIAVTVKNITGLGSFSLQQHLTQLESAAESRMKLLSAQEWALSILSCLQQKQHCCTFLHELKYSTSLPLKPGVTSLRGACKVRSKVQSPVRSHLSTPICGVKGSSEVESQFETGVMTRKCLKMANKDARFENCSW